MCTWLAIRTSADFWIRPTLVMSVNPENYSSPESLTRVAPNLFSAALLMFDFVGGVKFPEQKSSVSENKPRDAEMVYTEVKSSSNVMEKNDILNEITQTILIVDNTWRGERPEVPVCCGSHKPPTATH